MLAQSRRSAAYDLAAICSAVTPIQRRRAKHPSGQLFARASRLKELVDGADLRTPRDHRLERLLTTRWSGALFGAVLGGTELTDEDLVYGPARYLPPAEVRGTAQGLKPISFGELWSRLDERTFARPNSTGRRRLKVKPMFARTPKLFKPSSSRRPPQTRP